MNRLKIRFKKFNHGIIIGRKKTTTTRTKGGPEAAETLDEDVRKSRRQWLKPFDDISGYSGVIALENYYLFGFTN
jgi:hypothetical protein